jgi:3-isopropylmalate/(R)-2-methylmalate dehydratase small subunit
MVGNLAERDYLKRCAMTCGRGVRRRGWEEDGMSVIISGRVWKFGDHVSTDVIAPSFAEEYPWEERKKYILHIHPAFTKGCQPGDVIVAGRNFGCGSSREGTPQNFKRLGIGCIVAESFGRICFRNCIANAVPVLALKGVSEIFEEGERLELDFEQSIVRNLTTGKQLQGAPLVPELIEIVRSGGILASLRAN